MLTAKNPWTVRLAITLSVGFLETRSNPDRGSHPLDMRPEDRFRRDSRTGGRSPGSRPDLNHHVATLSSAASADVVVATVAY
jgi:hypothetical protein